MVQWREIDLFFSVSSLAIAAMPLVCLQGVSLIFSQSKDLLKVGSLNPKVECLAHAILFSTVGWQDERLPRDMVENI